MAEKPLTGAELLKTTYDITRKHVANFAKRDVSELPPYEGTVIGFPNRDDARLRADFLEKNGIVHNVIKSIDPRPEATFRMFVDHNRPQYDPEDWNPFIWHPGMPRLYASSAFRDTVLNTADAPTRAGLVSGVTPELAFFLLSHLPQTRPLETSWWAARAEEVVINEIAPEISPNFATAIAPKFHELLQRDDLQFEARGVRIHMKHNNERNPQSLIFNKVYEEFIVDYLCAENFIAPLFHQIADETGLPITSLMRMQVERTLARADHRKDIEFLRQLKIHRRRDLLQVFLNSEIPEIREGLIHR